MRTIAECRVTYLKARYKTYDGATRRARFETGISKRFTYWVTLADIDLGNGRYMIARRIK